MFNWFDKLLVKIAKKILNKYAPTGEFIAYINEREEKVLKDLGGYGQPINETGIKSFWDFPDWLKTAGKVAGSAAKYYIDYKDQERKSEVTEAAYRQYAAEVADAKAEAQAAIDVNLTPMEITNVPTTKADVTDFTAVAAHGGLMNLPTRQRKRYYGGTDQEDIEIMEPESLGDFELQQEEGVNIGEQVFHDTGNPRTNAQNVWSSGAIDQEIYQMDFEIFFQSGDWQDHISSAAPEIGDMQMASADPILQDEYDKYVFDIQEQGGTPISIEQFREQAVSGMAIGGIAGLRHGGRPGYQFGIGPQQGLMPQGMMPQGLMPQQGLRPGYAEQGWVTKKSDVEEEQLPRMGQEARAAPTEQSYETIDFENESPYKIIEMKEPQGPILIENEEGIDIVLIGNEATEFNQLKDTFIKMGLDEKEAEKRALKFLQLNYKKGGRVKRAPGGIMDLGGMEKDYRTTGGFVPLGGRERADDVPARLSKNEFVMTADAVRAAGGGSINKGAQRMYDTMKHLEASPQSNRMIS